MNLKALILYKMASTLSDEDDELFDFECDEKIEAAKQAVIEQF